MRSCASSTIKKSKVFRPIFLSRSLMAPPLSWNNLRYPTHYVCACISHDHMQKSHHLHVPSCGIFTAPSSLLVDFILSQIHLACFTTSSSVKGGSRVSASVSRLMSLFFLICASLVISLSTLAKNRSRVLNTATARAYLSSSVSDVLSQSRTCHFCTPSSENLPSGQNLSECE